MKFLGLSASTNLLMSVAFGASMTPLKKRMEAHMKRPPQSGYDRPLNVEIGFYLESLGNFRETQMVARPVFRECKDCSVSSCDYTQLQYVYCKRWNNRLFMQVGKFLSRVVFPALK
uniref:Uncharacterized protein n=1 Tax=Parascaris equorum TaxID=6256 RepID=A0A914S031_PAREQ